MRTASAAAAAAMPHWSSAAPSRSSKPKSGLLGRQQHQQQHLDERMSEALRKVCACSFTGLCANSHSSLRAHAQARKQGTDPKVVSKLTDAHGLLQAYLAAGLPSAACW